MKKTTSIIMTAVITAIIFSAVILGCSKDNGSSSSSGGSTYVDPCSGVTCLNGGSCSGGVCNCPTGYTGTRCETKVSAGKGTIQFINNSTNPYDVYIAAVFQTTLEGRHSISYTIDEGSYTCRVIQKSGYLTYPTDQSYPVVVVKGGSQVVSFP